ncbi:conjugal transfer protein TrbB (plasmid) [Klebsiella pneumoniae]|nr:conjugal transfer protein TrbB [Klebsiella pneumoniae]
MKNSLKNLAKTPLAALALSLALAGMAHAGTLDEVKSLWDPQGISGTETASPQSSTPQAVSGASQPRWLRLSNGKQVTCATGKWCCSCRGTVPTVINLTRC